jgi:hypothetical protein
MGHALSVGTKEFQEWTKSFNICCGDRIVSDRLYGMLTTKTAAAAAAATADVSV